MDQVSNELTIQIYASGPYLANEDPRNGAGHRLFLGKGYRLFH